MGLRIRPRREPLLDGVAWAPRVSRRADRLARLVVRRMARGRAPQPGWLPRRRVTVVAADADLTEGVAAVWTVWRPRSAHALSYTHLLERDSRGTWVCPDGSLGEGAEPLPGRRAAGEPGQVGMIEYAGGAGALSFVYHREHDPSTYHLAPWIGLGRLRIAAEASHLLLSGRRVPVPPSGMMLVVWRAPRLSPSQPAPRPPLACTSPDGAVLSTMDPLTEVDSYTWSQLPD
jgi:hypothetical protein